MRKVYYLRRDMADAEKQLQRFIAKYSPDIARTAKQVREKLRRRMAGTLELVYDNYNALVMAYSPTPKLNDVICSIALYPRWVTLFFMHGAKLRDPHKVLKGSGSKVRHVVLEDGVKTLDQREVRELFEEAWQIAPTLPVGKRPPQTIIKSISAKQRPRRAAKKPVAKKT